MDTAQWSQGIGVVVRPVENPKKPRPEKEQALNCPRCNSTNTKFCYYNNYSLSQPRYFCKTCRRYWTEGGTLRNVPVGGGSRKNKRSPSCSTSNSSSSTKVELPPDLSPPKFSPQNPKIHDGQDLNSAYNPPIYNGLSEFSALPFVLDPKIDLHPPNPNIGNLINSMPVSDHSNSVYSSSSSFPLHEFKPSLSFSLDGLEKYGSHGNLQDVQDHRITSSRTLFPLEELKPVSTSEFELQDRGQFGDSIGCWNGMLAGGSW